MTPPPDPNWLTYQQAADRLGCSTKTLQRRVNAGDLTAHKRIGYAGPVFAAQDIAALAEPTPVKAAAQ